MKPGLMALCLVGAAALLACGPTTYVNNRDSFRDNIEGRVSELEEKVSGLGDLVEERPYADPGFIKFVNTVNVDIAELRAELDEIDALDDAAWATARHRITRQVRQLEQRLARVNVDSYP
jgi:hypothetical protein